MSFINGILNGISKFKEAAKAGGEFNPLLKDIMDEIEKLHKEGRISDIVFQAEQAFTKEHGEYIAVGSHAGPEDHKRDIEALKHFVSTLATSNDVPAELKDKIKKLTDLENTMEDVLGSITKIF